MIPQPEPFLCRPHTNLVERLLKERPGAVLDIGAHIGGYFQYWLDNGATRIAGFEPVPWLFYAMAAKWGDHRSVELYCLAASDYEVSVRGAKLYGTYTINTPGETDMELAIDPANRSFDFQAIKIDDWRVGTQFTEPIALIKLDVDGYEPKALRGMKYTLTTHRPPIMLELSGLPEKLGDSCQGMIDWLYGRDYRICTMDGQVCPNVATVMKYYPFHTSFDVCAVPAERIKSYWGIIS